MAKKYYWLRLKEDFFSQPKIKKLRKIAGGDTYTIIYLKMQLLSLNTEGNLYFEGIEDDFIEELALTIDEDVDNVKFTVMYLINQHLLEEIQKDEFSLPEAKIAIGTESESTQRVRRLREKKKKEKALQCNTNVTSCNADETICNTEIEKELEIDIEIEKDNNTCKHDYENVLDQFKKICTLLPTPRALTDARKRAIKSILKTYSMDEIIEVFKNAQSSEFLTVKWQASFDWLMMSKNFIKVLEGNYKNKENSDPNAINTSFASNEKWNRIAKEQKEKREREKLNGKCI